MSKMTPIGVRLNLKNFILISCAVSRAVSCAVGLNVVDKPEIDETFFSAL